MEHHCLLGDLSCVHTIAVYALESLCLEDSVNGRRYKMFLFQVLKVFGFIRKLFVTERTVRAVDFHRCCADFGLAAGLQLEEDQVEGIRDQGKIDLRVSQDLFWCCGVDIEVREEDSSNAF